MANTADQQNVDLFATLAKDWWNPEGSSKLLHRVNPVRLEFIHEQLAQHFGRDRRARQILTGLKTLDVGCGAGLVTEPMARMGAEAVGLDVGPEVIEAARTHAAKQKLQIDYHIGQATEFAAKWAGRFDVITCLEVIEHVTDRLAFLKALRRMLKSEGLLIISTPNRTPLSWAVLIAGAEYIVRNIPVGGHNWKQFITPDELTADMLEAGLRLEQLKGLEWSPSAGFRIGSNLAVNYIGTALPF